MMRRFPLRLTVLLLSSSPGLSAQAPAAAQPSAPARPVALADDPTLESNEASIDRREPVHATAAPIPFVAAWLGISQLWLPSDGLDPFSEDDALTTFNAGAALSLASVGVLDVAGVIGVDATSSDARYRGEATALSLTRLTLGPELRGSLLDRLYWHGRLGPTVTRLSAELDESSSRATLDTTRWVWGAEAAAGLELRVVEAPTSLPDALGVFVRLDAGYAWSPSSTLELEAGSGAPVRTEPLELGELSLAGPFFRANLGVGL